MRTDIRKYSPVAGDVHVNTPLTNISIAYMQNQQNFIADKVFPNVPVSKKSDRYYTYDRGDFNRDEMKKRAPGTQSAGGGYNIDNTPTYFCEVWAFHKDIPDEVRANSDAVLMPDREATEYCTLKGLIRKEKLWTENFFTTGIWDTDDTTADWSPDGDDPIVDIRTARRTVLENTGFMPNTLVFGKATWDTLVDNPDIIDRVKYGQTAGSPAQGTLNAMKALFEIDNIYVAMAIENTANEGATESSAFIATGNSALLCYSAPSPGLMTPSAGYTFSWTGFMGAGAQGGRIKRFRRGEEYEADRIEIQMAFDQQVIASDLGYMFTGITLV